jgi:hypothetical protein
MGDGVVEFALSSEARTQPVRRMPDSPLEDRPVLRAVPEPVEPVVPRPSRRAVVRSAVWGVRAPATQPELEPVLEPVTEPVVEAAPPATVVVTGVSEVLRLPGRADTACYRISVDVWCAPVDGALPTVVGMELGGASANVMPRRTPLRPGDQHVTMVVSGPVAEQRLTLVYELDGARLRASVELSGQPALHPSATA